MLLKGNIKNPYSIRFNSTRVGYGLLTYNYITYVIIY